MDYTAYFESYADIWVKVDLFRNLHLRSLSLETFVTICLPILRNKICSEI